jgi:hypothetical protein
MSKTNVLLFLLLFSITVTGAASEKSDYFIGLHETGKRAQKIYQALDAPEQFEEFSLKVNPNKQESHTYKVGENILCVKTVYLTKKKPANFICSSGFNSNGKSESIQN